MMAMALGGACTIHAQSAPTGAWRSGAITAACLGEVDPLSDIRNTRAIAAVFQRGRQVVR